MDISLIISIVSIVVSACVAGLTIFFETRRKAYEILIQHRLQSLDNIRDVTSKLVLLLSPSKIRQLNANASYSFNDYEVEIETLICELSKDVKIFISPENVLFELLHSAFDCAKKFYISSNENDEEKLRLALEKFKMISYKYDWTLWKYHQYLHNAKRKRYTKLFNKMYAEVEKIAKGNGF